MDNNENTRRDAIEILAIGFTVMYPTLESYLRHEKHRLKDMYIESLAKKDYKKMSKITATALANGYKMPEV